MPFPADHLPDPQVEAQERAYALSRLAEEEATFEFEEVRDKDPCVNDLRPPWQEPWEKTWRQMEEEDRGRYDLEGRVF